MKYSTTMAILAFFNAVSAAPAPAALPPCPTPSIHNRGLGFACNPGSPAVERDSVAGIEPPVEKWHRIHGPKSHTRHHKVTSTVTVPASSVQPSAETAATASPSRNQLEDRWVVGMGSQMVTFGEAEKTNTYHPTHSHKWTKTEFLPLTTTSTRHRHAIGTSYSTSYIYDENYTPAPKTRTIMEEGTVVEIHTKRPASTTTIYFDAPEPITSASVVDNVIISANPITVTETQYIMPAPTPSSAESTSVTTTTISSAYTTMTMDPVTVTHTMDTVIVTSTMDPSTITASESMSVTTTTISSAYTTMTMDPVTVTHTNTMDPVIITQTESEVTITTTSTTTLPSLVTAGMFRRDAATEKRKNKYVAGERLDTPSEFPKDTKCYRPWLQYDIFERMDYQGPPVCEIADEAVNACYIEGLMPKPDPTHVLTHSATMAAKTVTAYVMETQVVDVVDDVDDSPPSFTLEKRHKKNEAPKIGGGTYECKLKDNQVMVKCRSKYLDENKHTKHTSYWCQLLTPVVV